MRHRDAKVKGGAKVARTEQRLAAMSTESAWARAGFIATELALASTFCDIAKLTNSPGRREDNARNARRAYQAAVRFLDREKLPEFEVPRLMEGVRRVEDRLSSLQV